MHAKALELRDAGTFIAVLAVDMNPTNDEQRYLLRRCGYACDGRPNVIITRLDGGGRGGTPATNDMYSGAWKGCRTWMTAHDYIVNHWHELRDGDVVDVEYILGETLTRKRSERELPYG